MALATISIEVSVAILEVRKYDRQNLLVIIDRKPSKIDDNLVTEIAKRVKKIAKEEFPEMKEFGLKLQYRNTNDHK
jgi:hypothetical protein